MKKQLIAKLAIIALGAAAGAAQADSVTPAPQFQVKIKINKTCKVATAPTDIVLGGAPGVASDATNVTGNMTFSVNCSKSTPFFIGLAPSTANGGDTAGNGKMKGTGASPDSVPYTLYSDNGTTVWGNTATTTDKGNGVTDTGAGMGASAVKSFTVYAKAPSADYKPDSYSDTVTVNINY